ncbi:MAG: hypothetical protein B6226_00045 [Candidatus Cloacimonetes bacterium 4572_65]|nr:MAG: hypothetical protein B6226_00045 [Candidatus Cloacimonetes bacterium 4572_65]
MKRLLITLIFFSIMCIAIGQTIIDTPTVNGVWTAANSPYEVLASIEIPQGDSLLIESGVTVYMAESTTFQVSGKLLVDGSDSQNVVITTITGTTMWNSINIDGSDSDMNYLEIIGATEGIVINKTASLTNSKISGYNPDDFTRGIYLGYSNESTLYNIEVKDYKTGAYIMGDEDDDDDHGTTVPTLDVIRVYLSPESWKNIRTNDAVGVIVDGGACPTISTIDIENYDTGMEIKGDEEDADGDRLPTAPVLDIVRVYLSPESWKANRTDTKGIVITSKTAPTLVDVEISEYDTGIEIKADPDEDDDHGTTVPTLDVIRVYLSPESWKSNRATTKGIVIEGRVNPTLTQIDIENYDTGIEIKADPDDDDDGTTVPTLDVIRVYLSPESWKTTRTTTKGIVLTGNIDLTLNDCEFNNYDVAMDLRGEGSHTLTDIDINMEDANRARSYGIKTKGDISIDVNGISVHNYDYGIYMYSQSFIVNTNIENALLSQSINANRANSRAIYGRGAINLTIDNALITDYDRSIYLNNNLYTNVDIDIQHTEIHQSEGRRGNIRGIELRGNVEVNIENNIIESCDPAIKIVGTNAVSDINRNLIYLTYDKPNSKAIDLYNIDSNIMNHNTIVEYSKAVYSPYTENQLTNNIIWSAEPTGNIVTDNDYVTANYNNIALPNSEIFTGINNINEDPSFVEDDSNFYGKNAKELAFQLNSDSPCIDAGNPSYDSDPDGSIPDLGIYPFVGNKDNDSPVASKMQLSNYPNPFNPTTNILYNIKENAHIDIRIYNIKGQLVKKLINENQTTGRYSVVWNGVDNKANNVASGIYFVKMKQGNKSISKKIILTK